MPLNLLKARLVVVREEAKWCSEHECRIRAADCEKQAAEFERLIEAKEKECA